MDVSAGKAVVRDEIEASPRRLTTVVAADICGYSRLAEASDEAAVRTVTIVRTAFERVVANRRGRIFHAAGDGFLAEFPSAADGVLAALEFVADIRARNNLSPTSPGAAVRAGVHAGDVVEQPGGDLLGHGVNIAARLQGEAEPNGVLVSLAVVNLVRGGVDAHFSRRGPLALKNIDEPVVAFDAMEGGARARRALLSILRNHRVQIAGLILLALVAVNIGVMGLSLRRPAPPASRDASDEPTRAANALTDRLIRRLDANRRGDYADPLRFESASNAILALQRSDRADKAVTVVSLIDRGELNSAAEMLERIYEEQTAAGLSASARIETLSQIAAVIFHQDTTKAIARNVELLTLAEGPAFDDDERVLLAHYALAALYHRVNDPERANAHFSAMISRAPEDDEVRLWAELGFLNSWLMKPEIGPADFDQIEARLLALQPSLAAFQRKHADAEFWTTYASLDYFRGGFSGDAAAKRSAVEKQRRAVAIEEKLAIGRRPSAGLARAYMRLGALQIDSPDREAGVEALKNALAASRAAQDRQTEGSALLNLAYAMNDAASYEEASAYAQDALALAQAERRPNLKALSRHLLADIAAASNGVQAEACDLYRAAIADYAATPLSSSGVVASARESMRALNCEEAA